MRTEGRTKASSSIDDMRGGGKVKEKDKKETAQKRRWKESKAKENIVTFAKEQIVFSSMRRETDKIETFERAGMEANRSMNGREFNDFINSKSAMKLEGYNIIGTYPIRNTALYNSTDCVAVVQWSPEGVEGANIIKKDMSSSTSSNSSTDASKQDAQSTTSGQTSSDDF